MCWNFCIDFSDLVTTAAGAFLGFLLAFWLQAIFDKKRRKQTIQNVRFELSDLFTFLERNKDNRMVTNEIYVPIWEAVTGNGDILSYIKKPYYSELIEVYTHILSLKELESSLNYVKNQEEQEKCLTAILTKRNTVYNKLTALNINDLK